MIFVGDNFSEAVALIREMADMHNVALKNNFDSRPKEIGDRVTIWSLIGCAIKRGDNECTYVTRKEIPEDKEFIVIETNGNYPSTMVLISYIVLDSENDIKLVDPITNDIIYTKSELIKRIDNFNI